MTLLAAALISAPFVALMLWIARELGVLIAMSRCTCTRHRICAACLAASRPKPEREAA